MPAVDTQNDAARIAAIKAVETDAAALRANEEKGQSLRWTLSLSLFALRQTFGETPEERAAWMSTATTASKLDDSVVRNLVKAVEVRTALTPKQAERTASWPTDSVLTLTGKDSDGEPMTASHRNRIIAKAEKAGTTNTKTIRGFKRDVVGTTKRDRQASPEATVKLAGEIRERVEALLADYPVAAIVAGVNLHKDHPVSFLDDVVTHIAANPVVSETATDEVPA